MKPRKKKAVTRICYIGARFTPDEKALFVKRHKVAIKGRKASELIRGLLLNGEIK